MILLFIPTGIVATFGKIELESIIFHIFMPKKDMSFDWLKDLSPYFFLAFISSLFLMSLSIIGKRIKIIRNLLFVFIITVTSFGIFRLDSTFLVHEYILNQYHSSNFIEKHYIDPEKVKFTFPQKKKNLIFIQVESLESSFQDKQHGGLLDNNYIPELTKLAEENINFSSSNLVGGAIVLPETGWTMGGLIAETAGIPLKSYKIHKSHDQIGNTYNQYKSFLNNVTSLGDILSSFGYKNYFILGSSKDFAGQDAFLKKHGKYTIYDYAFIKNSMKFEKPQEQWWGLLDRDVFEFSKNKLLSLAASKEYFSVIIQTIDSHREGFLSPDCSHQYDQLIKNVYACVSNHINSFISWCKDQDFFENTVIVIVGDHCNMSRTLFNENISKETGLYEGMSRKIYNVFINSSIKPIQEKRRIFSTMDIFPTTLASMGVTIEGDRLGLGTNLFSDKKTLLEQYGYDFLYQELRKKSNFYNHKLLYSR